MIFTTVPRLFCRPGARHEVGTLIANLISSTKQHAQSIVVVTDPGVRKLQLTKDVEKCIEDLGITAHVFDRVAEDPSESVILDLANFMIERNCTGVFKLINIILKNTHTLFIIVHSCVLKIFIGCGSWRRQFIGCCEIRCILGQQGCSSDTRSMLWCWKYFRKKATVTTNSHYRCPSKYLILCV